MRLSPGVWDSLLELSISLGFGIELGLRLKAGACIDKVMEGVSTGDERES